MFLQTYGVFFSFFNLHKNNQNIWPVFDICCVVITPLCCFALFHVEDK